MTNPIPSDRKGQSGRPPSILVVAGEVSGDMHAACLVRALREKAPDLAVFGIGGDALRAAGAELIHHVNEMAVFGLPDVLKRIPFFRAVFRRMIAVARARRPDLVLLVDYGGFNLRFARQAKKLGLRVVYYVSPQVWASRRARIRTMARFLDRLIVIFPFEKEVFAHTSLAVDFVGHPLVDEARAARAEPETPLPWRSGIRLALLPGSRRQEVERILPRMWAAAEHLRNKMPSLDWLVAAPNPDVAAIARNLLGHAADRIVVGQTRQVLRQARAALVASGTATVESALMGCPLVVVYRTRWITYWLARGLIRVPCIGMVNIIAGRPICPELIQSAATPRALAKAVRVLLLDTPERARMIEALNEVAEKLGPPGAADRAAAIVLAELGA
jgi:lipid-A-disaccharide synthase